MSGALRRLREVVAPSSLARLLLGFVVATLLFAALWTFSTGFVCIGYACPPFAIPGDRYFHWPDHHALINGLQQTGMFAAPVFALTLIGVLFRIRSVLLWIIPWLAFAVLALPGIMAMSDQYGESGTYYYPRIAAAFAALLLAFLLPFLTYHWIAWRSVSACLSA